MNPDMRPSDPCRILGDSVAAKLLEESDILILDEIAMMNKVDLERIESSLRELMDNDNPFGGKIVILSGDFRQILPVEKWPFIYIFILKIVCWVERAIRSILVLNIAIYI